MSQLGQDLGSFIGRVLATVILLAAALLVVFTYLIIRGSL
jgi:hypothetical protein